VSIQTNEMFYMCKFGFKLVSRVNTSYIPSCWQSQDVVLLDLDTSNTITIGATRHCHKTTVYVLSLDGFIENINTLYKEKDRTTASRHTTSVIVSCKSSAYWSWWDFVMVIVVDDVVIGCGKKAISFELSRMFVNET